MALGREIKDFLGTFGAVTHMGNEKRRADAYDRISRQKGTSAGLPSQEEMDRRYREKYGAGAPGAPSTGVGGFLRKIGNSVLGTGTSSPAAGSSETPGAVSNYEPGSIQTEALDPPPAPDNGGYEQAADPNFAETYSEGGLVQGYEGGGAVDEPVPVPVEGQTVAPAAPPVIVPDLPEHDVSGVRTAPFEGVPQFGAGDLPVRQREAVPTRAAAPKGPKRKALNDQTRTEAYDPVLDKDDPDNVIRMAINGAMDYANDTFHLHGKSGDAVGSTDPHTPGGRKAFMGGTGAAPEADVQALDAVAAQSYPDKKLLASDPNVRDSIIGLRRLELIYDHFVQTGQTDKANKAAFEIIQYSAGQAAKYGQQAVAAFQAGDAKGAAQAVARGYSQVPDGNHMVIGPDGKTAFIRDPQGKVIQKIPFGPKELVNAALGLSNKSLFWEVLANRASMVGGAKQQSASKEALDAARVENLKARTDAVRKKMQGGGTAAPPAPSPVSGLLNDLNSRTGITPQSPNQGEVDGQSAPPQQQAEAIDPDTGADNVALDAPPGLKDTPAPNSVLRVKPPGAQQGTPPAPSPALDKVTPAGKFNPDGDGYDEASAKAAGLKPDETGHWPSRDPKSGLILKGRGHETFSKTVEGERKAGYQIFKGQDGRYYSVMDNVAVPDEIVHDGKQADTQPYSPPKYEEPHPLDSLKGTKFEGSNPYTKVLQDESFRKWVAANSRKGQGGPQELARVQSMEREMNKRVGDWEKGKKAHAKEFTDAHAKEQQQAVAEARRVYDRSLSTRELETLPGEIDTHVKAITEAKDKEGKPRPSIFTAPPEVAKPDELNGLAVNLFTSNRNLTPSMSARLVAELTTPGTEPKERQFMPLGKDRAGNVVVRLKADDSVEVHVRPGAYRKINALTERYRLHLLKEQEKPVETPNGLTQFGGPTDQKTADLLRKVPDYLANRDLMKGGGALADTARVLTYPVRKGAEGVVEMLKRARDNKDQGYNPPPLY